MGHLMDCSLCDTFSTGYDSGRVAVRAADAMHDGELALVPEPLHRREKGREAVVPAHRSGLGFAPR